VRDGVLGALRLVQVEYIQSGLATRIEDAPANNRLRWLLDPGRSGLALVMSAIGCHAQHLACFAAGRNVTRLVADVRALLPGRTLIDYVSALFELDGGARGTLSVTQAAAGGEKDSQEREQQTDAAHHGVDKEAGRRARRERDRSAGAARRCAPHEMVLGASALYHPNNRRWYVANCRFAVFCAISISDIEHHLRRRFPCSSNAQRCFVEKSTLKPKWNLISTLNFGPPGPRCFAPTLRPMDLIAGIMQLSRSAQTRLRCESEVDGFASRTRRFKTVKDTGSLSACRKTERLN